jgi:hypothetical protein
MKKFFFPLLILMLFFSGNTFAQLADTKWQGTFYIPSENECYLHFKKDTLTLEFAETGDIIETMKYSVSGDTLTISKLAGGSPCESSDAFYRLKVSADKLKLTILKDDCGARASAGLDGDLTKVIEGTKKKED